LLYRYSIHVLHFKKTCGLLIWMIFCYSKRIRCIC
jgi:hypothetical protein